MSRLPHFRSLLILAALLPLALLPAPLMAAAETNAERTPPSLGAEHAPDFGLQDYRGKFYQLHRADARAVVLFITGNGYDNVVIDPHTGRAEGIALFTIKF